MLFAQLVEDNGTGRVAVAEVARKVCALNQFIQKFLREAVFMLGEVAPVKQHRHAGDFPVAGRRIFTGRKFMRPCVSADNFRAAVHTGGNFTGRTLMGFNQPQTGQIR